MREHPIPQDITGYRFHIIGSMTIKQFAEIAAGCIGGLVIYATNLLPFIKWPLISISVGLGAAAAFLPIAERPLDHWVTTFIRVMYRPTKFFWKRSSKVPDVFTYVPTTHTTELNDQVDLSPARRERIREYMASVQDSPTSSLLDEAEYARMQEIMNTFRTLVPTSVSATKQSEKPQLKVRVRSLQTNSLESGGLTTNEVLVFSQNTPLSKQQLAATDVAREVAIPEIELIKIADQKKAPEEQHILSSDPTKTGSHLSADEISTLSPDLDNSQSTAASATSATLNASLPFPQKPTTPNQLVGMILTPNNELIPEAIVEIRDEHDRVVRAVKSNALGQFYVTTPLENGAYTVMVERDTFQFLPQQLTLGGEVVDPIEIHSV